MKKQVQSDYAKQVKILSKQFKILDHHFIRLLFEFCDFEGLRTYKILQMIKDMHAPSAFIKKLADSPHEYEQIIKQKESEFDKKYGNVKIGIFQSLYQNTEPKMMKMKTKNYQLSQTNSDFFENIPRDVCASIISYLDPFSFSQVSQVNKKLYKISKSAALQFYFKMLCLKIYKNELPQLPQICRFGEVKQYVQDHQKDYGPNIRNAVSNNLRYFVWKTEPKSFKTSFAHYKQFGSYRNIFMQAPRVHLNGIYVCKHKYVKLGEKGFHLTVTPIHVIHYYRYIRFFQDGSLLCYVSNNKIRKQQLSVFLSRQKLENFNSKNTSELKIGQYMQYKNTLFLKIVKFNTVLNYQLSINSNQNKNNDELMVMSSTLELIDEREMVQKLYEYKPHKQKILFHYLRNEGVEADNPSQLQAISL